MNWLKIAFQATIIVGTVAIGAIGLAWVTGNLVTGGMIAALCSLSIFEGVMIFGFMATRHMARQKEVIKKHETRLNNL